VHPARLISLYRAWTQESAAPAGGKGASVS